MRTILLIAAITAMIVVPFVSSASAQQRVLQTMEAGQKLEPIRVAPVLGWENGKPKIGKWQAYHKNANAGAGFPTGVILDSFEGDAFYGNPDLCDADAATAFPCNGALSGGIDPACDFALGYTGACGSGDDTRWFVGVGGTWAGAIGPMASFADNAPTVSTGQCFAWYQSYGSDSAPPCDTYVTTYAIIEIFDNSVASLIDGISELDATTLGNGFIDGLILDFGPVATGGYYFANIDLTLSDPELHLGIVGGLEVGIPENGALEILYWDDDGLGGIVPGSYAQSMLWDAKDASLQGAWADGIYYLDGSTDGITYDCPAYDGQYLIATNDDWFNLNDQWWPGGCPNYLMPMIGLFGEPSVAICASSGVLVEGTSELNDFNSTCGSDDTRWGAHGETFFYQIADPVVQFELSATASTATPGSISVDIEASKANNNANLNLRALMFNFVSGTYIALPGTMALGTADAVQTFNLPNGATPSEFVDPGTNEVRLLLQTIQTSGVPNVRTLLDEVLFHVN